MAHILMGVGHVEMEVVVEDVMDAVVVVGDVMDAVVVVAVGTAGVKVSLHEYSKYF